MNTERRTPIQIGRSRASVLRIQRADGVEWIEKSGPVAEIEQEACALRWCAERLPVPRILAASSGGLRMSVVAGVTLEQLRMVDAAKVLVQALGLMHSLPAVDCPLDAAWERKLQSADANIRAGLVEESDFDESNLGRAPDDILEELRSMPPLPERRCFTHGDACLPNFLADAGELSGIVDLGRAGVAHPAQDWALALRSMKDNFGVEGERFLRRYLPDHSSEPQLLYRFRLLDELF